MMALRGRGDGDHVAELAKHIRNGVIRRGDASIQLIIGTQRNELPIRKTRQGSPIHR